LFALRCQHGAYLRLCPDDKLRSDGESPSDPSCVFVLQKGGVALHMRVTARAANGLCVAWSGDGGVAAGGAGATGGGSGARDCERWQCEPAATRNVYTFKTRGDAFLTACADGEVLTLPAGMCPAPAQLFWMVKPAEEQARVDAFRSTPAAAPVAPAPPRGGDGAAAAAPSAATIAMLQSQLCASAQAGDVVRLRLLRTTPELRDAINDADTSLASGATPLHHAVGGQHAACVGELLEWGARTEVTDNDGDTPLHVAALRGYWEIAERLLASGASTAAKNVDGSRPLHYAANGGSARTVLLLVGRGAAIAAKDDNGETALHVAARCNRKSAAKALLLAAEAACPQLLDCGNAAGFNALHVAATEGHCSIATLLLDTGAAIDARSSNTFAWTALHCAASCGHADVVQLLVARGADVEAAGSKQETPRDVATCDKVHSLLPKLRDVAEEAVTPAEMLAAALATATAGVADMHVEAAAAAQQLAPKVSAAPTKQQRGTAAPAEGSRTGGSGTTHKPSGAMAGWSREQVQAWMHANGFDAYAEAFKPIVGATLVTLTDDDLQEMDVKIAVHRRSILHTIAAGSH
jgi:ankyrin repeat protein